MRKINKSSFSYGFEIEGVFSVDLINRLSVYCRKNDININTKDDGSVDIKPETGQVDDFYDYREVTIGILTFDKMIEVMKMFEYPHYQSNDTCGIHVHLGINRRIRNVLWDWGFINKLQSFASSLDSSIANRINDETSEFCSRYRNENSFSIAYRNGDKYRFIRNHPQGTFEIRAFSAGSNFVDNVRSLIGSFIDGANSCFNKKIINTVEIETKTEKKCVIL